MFFPNRRGDAVSEKDLIYDKNYTCTVCDRKFTAKTVKTGKARMIGTDKDLRPVHEGIDVQKYDVVSCPHCGYTAVTRYFTGVTSGQAKQIKEQISRKIKLPKFDGEVYTYEQALERYRLALANAVAKHAKTSETAYICLKSAWLLRGYSDAIKSGETDVVAEINDTETYLNKVCSLEESHMKSAYKGLLEASQSEPFPLCGMDETTVDYLLAAIGFRFGEYETASKLVAKVITSVSANARTKDKARDLKEEILQAMKDQKA